MKVTSRTRSQRPPLRLLLAAWTLGVAWCTLRPLTGVALARHQPVPWSCLVCGPGGLTDVILNVVLFLPLGILAARLAWPLRRTLFVALAATLAIEITQGTVLAGRDASVSDVLFNTVGAALGWLVARPRPGTGRRTWQRRTATLLGVHAMLWWGTGWLMRPDIDRAPLPWHSAVELFPVDAVATVHQVHLGGMRAESDSTLPAMVTLPLRQVTLELTHHLTDPATPRIRALTVRDSGWTELLTVDHGPRRTGIGLRLHAARWRFRTPAWVTAIGDRLPDDVATTLRWSWNDRGIDLAITPGHGAPATTSTLPFSVTDGWSLLHPFVGWIGEETRWWSLAWLGWWFGLLGLCAAPAGRRTAVVAGVVAPLLLLGAGLANGWPVRAVEAGGAVLAYLALWGAGRWYQKQKAPHMERDAF